ncbi:MAG: hypothetical protein A2583_14385 [Bdellovibrionales bacterium RIFOXYD1_FULL_53_11]|nr:MAG: hypothetical protein A2583_14385 [Bdellovibrionales bacterium RIFOXYD1_FULL_53_11]
MVEKIHDKDVLLAIILRSSYNKPGITFLTPGEFSQQLAYMRHPSGKVIEPHVHNPVPREVEYTQEVLHLRRGRMRVDFFREDQSFIESRILVAGDTVLLVRGGHGFEALEEIEMIEIKQGPYVGEHDKTRFKGITK